MNGTDDGLAVVAVTLTIPDNAALTARATLERLGLPLGGLVRADLYRLDLGATGRAEALAALRDVERVFNPNKHRWEPRDDGAPLAGEIWVRDAADAEAADAEAATGSLARIGGRTLPGIRRIDTFTAWRLTAPDGSPASPELAHRAATLLLANPAFQRMED